MPRQARPIILTFVSYYLPGYKSGGPLRTIVNMVQYLGDEFDYWIVTRDRDVLDTKPYDNVLVNQWQKVGKAQVYYCSPENATIRNLKKLMNDTPHDAIYLNSFFDFTLTCKPLLACFFEKKLPKSIILAPRGEFSQGALHLKKFKKIIYIYVTRLLGLYNHLIWQASSEREADNIKQQSFIDTKIHVALDLPSPVYDIGKHIDSNLNMRSSELRILFLSRITPMKNLSYALTVISKIRVNIIFDIYGPLEDLTYWKKCQIEMNLLPDNVKIKYCGSVAHDKVTSVFSRYDLFFLPTCGENYGHVIAESLSAGTPVLISDQTPWQELKKEGLGWEFPLENEEQFVQCIEQYAVSTISERQAWRIQIQNKMLDKLYSSEIFEANRQLFYIVSNKWG